MAKIRVRQSQLINSLKEGFAKGLLQRCGWASVPGKEYLPSEHLPVNLLLGKDRAGCQGCAVGNVFAELLSPNTSVQKLNNYIENVITDEGDYSSCSFGRVDTGILSDLLENNRYLTALSHVFEGTMDELNYNDDEEDNTARALKACIDLIKKRFPKTITLDIDGFTPKRKDRCRKTHRAKVPGQRSKSTRRAV